jgi:alkylation response protein AidB-like acyl-CoA dehydrogenase
MITNMRLATGSAWLAVASRATEIAYGYAAERRQGGNGPQPVTIHDHADAAHCSRSRRGLNLCAG